MSTDNDAPAQRIYNTLINHLHPPSPTVLEIDILPSSSGPEIQFSAADGALGIPKSVLVQCFLIARQQFFALRRHEPSCTDGNVLGDNVAALRASSILLLWDPAHFTAINYRKRYLLAHPEALNFQQELCLTESLLTSPMPKHTKAPALWGHRLWLLQESRFSRRKECELDEALGNLWGKELDIVMGAGERHPRNYYGWEFSRAVVRMLWERRSDEGHEMEQFPCLITDNVEKVHKWCLMHPRDVSGWSFLSWLLGQLDDTDLAEKIDWETKEFIRKYAWQGESIEYFVNNMHQLTIQQIGII